MALSNNVTMPVKTLLTIKGEGTVDEQVSEKMFNACYIRVELVNATKTLASAVVSTKLSEKLTVQSTYQFEVNLDGPNFIAQAYEHLKTLPEFSDATDC